MGCSHSKSFTPNYKQGQGNEVMETAKIFGYTQHDLNLLYGYFSDCNVNNDGHLSITEFLVMSDLDGSKGMKLLGEVIFRLFDGLNDSKLTFHELILCLYFFCTQERDLLELFAFQLFDADDSGVMTSQEVSFMVSMIWGMHTTVTYSKGHKRTETTHDKHVEDALKLLDADHSGDVTLEEFLVYVKKAPIVLFPIFELQMKLRDKTLGRSRWEYFAEYRERRTRHKNVQTGKDHPDKAVMVALLTPPCQKHQALSFLLDIFHGEDRKKLPETFLERIGGNSNEKVQNTCYNVQFLLFL